MSLHEEAFVESYEAIRAQRRTPTLEDATRLVHDSVARRGLDVSAEVCERFAFDALHPNWPFLHPIKAHRAGWRLQWPWQRD